MDGTASGARRPRYLRELAPGSKEHFSQKSVCLLGGCLKTKRGPLNAHEVKGAITDQTCSSAPDVNNAGTAALGVRKIPDPFQHRSGNDNHLTVPFQVEDNRRMKKNNTDRKNERLRRSVEL